MIMKRLALALLVVLVWACVTYPPPKIENGYYQNYRYGFVLDLPGSDWVVMEKPPPELTAAAPREMRKNLLLALINKETNGLIFVLSDKTQLSPQEIVTQSAGLQAGLSVGAGMQPELKDARHCHDSSTYLQDSDACVEFEHEDAMSKSKGNMFIRIFPVGKNVNMIMVVFASNHITYEQNFPAFVELVKSLKHGDEYTVSELTMEREGTRLERQRLEPDKQQLAYIPEDGIGRRIQLRSKSSELSIDDIKRMLSKYNFYDKDFNPEGSFANKFKDNGDGTVTDRATGLMWLIEAPAVKVEYGQYWSIDDAIKFFNVNRFAGYSDWRIPTIEELASILDPKGTDLLIPWVFRSPQSRIYISADRRVSTAKGYGSHWLVHFDRGVITSGGMWTTWRSNVLPFKAVRSIE
jgi:hypothetical protein